MHALPPQYVQAEFRQDCEKKKQESRDHIAYLKKNYPETQRYKKHEERLQRTFCPHNILIWKRDQINNKEMKIAPFVNQFGDNTHIRVREVSYPKGKDLKSLIQKRCLEVVPTEIYFDQQGKAYSPTKEQEYTAYVAKNNFTGIVVGYTGDTSYLTKRYLGLGRNLQAMVEMGEREYVICENKMHLRQTKNPEVYYAISYIFPDFLIGSYFAVDINNPDGSSSFLTK